MRRFRPIIHRFEGGPPARGRTFIVLAVLLLFAPVLQAQPRSFTLDELIEEALRQHRGLEATRYAVTEARAYVREQQADRLPEVVFSTGVSHLGEVPRLPLDLDGETVYIRQGASNTFVARVEARQTLLDFGRTRRSVAAARLGTDAAGAVLDEQAFDVVMQVKEQYYRERHYTRLDQVYAVVVPLNDVLLQIQEGRVAAGDALDPAYLEALVDVQQAMAQRAALQRDIRQSRIALAWLLGRPAVDFRLTGEEGDLPDLAPILSAYDLLYAYALAHRPDLQTLQRRYEQLVETAGAVAAEGRPLLDLFGDFSYYGPDVYGSYAGGAGQGLDPYNWRVGLRFTYPLYTGRRLSAQKAQALARAAQLQASQEQARLEIGAEIHSLLEDLRGLQLLQESHRTTLEQALSTQSVSKAQHSQGAIATLAHLRVLIATATANAGLEETRYQIRLRLLALERAIGIEFDWPGRAGFALNAPQK